MAGIKTTIKGRFLGEAQATKKGTGFVRKFLTDADALLTVFAKDKNDLVGDSVKIETGDFVFAG